MEILKSSVVRKDLTKILNGITKGEIEEVGIEVNGEIVAVLTSERPDYEIPPLFLRAEEAREDWAGVIETVAIQNARYYFRKKSSEICVYLRRHEDYRHAAAKRWKAHLTEYRNAKKEPLTIEDLHDSQEEMKHLVEQALAMIHQLDMKHKHVFARIERNGDLLATPENGVQARFNADDLGRYEVD
ncbi:hypothetical protein [Noviherbaspirillum aridicola]|uniref:Uncharacterized protein n=1 Tax=Noviherbaspirillum aridicola TaxID=2849687 RepID=A0ABQ4QB70_9BURK|nr:hypothetical protein [Noviherbaspirillum aridicola]GIZ54040.1 hypothetical protein NCCP691_40540 [Noviherbaspirillum aridicola]GIZ54076.1 hypothetical protein NCCP691_40900 [Noviherbaspirillum aridicola]